ncbi:MAG: outer membrane protein assembly factor BamA [Ignavibacteria bacterium]|nr:outer membrane protein assembly factor BamA [Ignavibacteria bacterium]
MKTPNIKSSALTIILIALLMSVFQPAFAQDEELAQYRIANISVKGNRTYESETIISFTGLNIGKEINIPSDETREALNRLWKIGIFSDIKLYVEKKFGKDVYLIIEVEEQPRVESIEITGNDEFSTEDLKEKINLSTGEVISEQKLKDIAYSLKLQYEEEGYALAEVEVDKLISANNEARIRVKITEGEELTVNKIIIDGNKSIGEDDVKGSMDETSEKTWWKVWDGASYDRKKFQQDKKLIEEYYRERGFKDATVVFDKLEILPGGEDVNIRIKVDEGKRYFIDDITIEGNKIYDDNIILQRLEMRSGDVYNMKKLQQNLYGNEAETDVSAIYLDNGYLSYNADVEEIPKGDNKVDLIIRINEGSQFRFGLVGFEGNDKTKERVLRREVYTKPGDYFSRSSIKRSLQQLGALNYFNQETMNQQITPENDSMVSIKYLVEERSSDQFNASVGFSGSFGITGSLGLTFNNFDIAAPFKGGAGQILNFNWSFGTGGTYRTFELGFQEPWLFNTPTQFGFNIFDTRQNYDNLDLNERGASVNTGRRFKFPDDYFRGDWTLKFQQTDVIDGDDFYEEGKRNQVSITQVITRSTVFEPLFPASGTRISNSTELSGGPFLPGNTDFIKNIFSAEGYIPLTANRKLVLYNNFVFSFVNSFAKDKYVPPNEVFFMGGNGLTYNTQALRGYEDRSVGPKNQFGSSIGGLVAAKYGMELRYSLSMDPLPIFILAFVEAGNVWSNIDKTDPFDLRKSFGVGTRLMLPAVGIVGFDFAYGFDRKIVDGQDPKWLFHFQFGRGF